jgi:hypothetical protein
MKKQLDMAVDNAVVLRESVSSTGFFMKVRVHP